MNKKKILAISGLAVIAPIAFASLTISCGCNNEKANAYGIELLNKYFRYDEKTKTSTLDLSTTSITHIKSGAFNGNFLRQVASADKNFKVSNLIPKEDNPANLPRINKLILPKTLEYIGKEAFSYLQIENIEFSGGNSLKVVDEKAFLGNKLTKLDFTNQNVEIRNQAFADNELTEVKLGNITKLYAGSFANNKLQNLDLSKVSEIEEGALSDNEFPSLTLPENVKKAPINFCVPKDGKFSETNKFKITIKNRELYEKMQAELNSSVLNKIIELLK